MSVIWLPNWKTNAYYVAYNNTYDSSTAFTKSCYYSKYQECIFCNKGIRIITENGTENYNLISRGGCNSMPAVTCQHVTANTINLVMNKTTNFVSTNYSDDTYLVFEYFFSDWGIIMCNKKTQGNFALIGVFWNWWWSMIGVLVGMFAFYISINFSY